MLGYDDSEDTRVECRDCGCVYDCTENCACPRCNPRQGRCATCMDDVPLTVVTDEGGAYCSQACADEPQIYASDGQAPATTETASSARDRIPTPAEGTPISMYGLVFGVGGL